MFPLDELEMRFDNCGFKRCCHLEEFKMHDRLR